MSLSIKIEIEAANEEDASYKIEQINMLIGKGSVVGDGFEVTGESEPEETEVEK